MIELYVSRCRRCGQIKGEADNWCNPNLGGRSWREHHFGAYRPYNGRQISGYVQSEKIKGENVNLGFQTWREWDSDVPAILVIPGEGK